MQQTPARWLAHTPMTEPGAASPLIEALPAGVATLNRVVQGLLIHGAWLSHYADGSAFNAISRTTLPVQDRLAALAQRGPPNLETRMPTLREVGTCRDFALMLCAFLRTKGTPARVRCGFAAYLGDGWEDHWVCEYWNIQAGRWCLSDAQLDDVIKTACNITFDPSDVPRDMFRTAGEAWRSCRFGSNDPNRYGQGSIKGIWFIGVNVVRDALSVNNREISAWDTWRDAPPAMRTVPPLEQEALDKRALTPEEASDEPTPPWLGGTANFATS
jgi:hypothetical protein